MTKQQRTYIPQRVSRGRQYSVLYIISPEGKTEKEYFSALDKIIKQRKDNKKTIKPLNPDNKSDPKHVQKRMDNYLQNKNKNPKYEAWLVVDVDNRDEDKLGSLYNWQKNRANYGLAVSNPSFEFWLLLHFEEGTDITSSKDCINRLESKGYLPNYSKTKIDSRKITIDHINNAIRRAKIIDSPPCKTWPQTTGTTVYKLVEKILSD